MSAFVMNIDTARLKDTQEADVAGQSRGPVPGGPSARRFGGGERFSKRCPGCDIRLPR
jgi:hypothetical protein